MGRCLGCSCTCRSETSQVWGLLAIDESQLSVQVDTNKNSFTKQCRRTEVWRDNLYGQTVLRLKKEQKETELLDKRDLQNPIRVSAPAPHDSLTVNVSRFPSVP